MQQVVASPQEIFKEKFDVFEIRASTTPYVCEAIIRPSITRSRPHSTCKRIFLPMESVQATHSRTIENGEIRA
jgi:hypothetical protein